MTRCVTDMLRDTVRDLEIALARGHVAMAETAARDAKAIVQDVAQIEADNDRLRKALRAVSRERDEWREKAHGAACDDNLMPLLAASVNGGE